MIPPAPKHQLQKTICLLPVLPVLFFFLHHLNQFRELMFSTDILLLFLAYCGLSFLVFFLIYKLLTREKYFAAVFSLLIMLCFLFFGILQDAFFASAQLRFFSNTFRLLFLMILLLVFAWFFLQKKLSRSYYLQRYLSFLFSILILLEAGLFTFKMLSGKSIHAVTSRMIAPAETGLKNHTGERPDIYYLIFDSYTNRPALQQYWNFDNPVYPYLASGGFYTVDSGFSNYKSTPFSVGSILNMRYLHGAEDYLVSNSFNFFVGQKLYEKNYLYRFLQQEGYRFSVFSQLHDKKLLTGFGFLGVEKPIKWMRNLTMERMYKNPWMQEKLKKWLGRNPDQQALKLKSMEPFADYNTKAIQHIRADCRQNAGAHSSEPVFSFTHFMLPHDPYLFDEYGNRVKNPEPGGANMAGYLNQIQYCNRLIKEITGCLLQDTLRKKIIVIQGDHGFRHFTDAPPERQFDALNAVYIYNGNYAGLKKTMSHVNTFRVIMNNVFGTDLPLLTDSIVIKKRKGNE
jgi:hypothetical protein